MAASAPVHGTEDVSGKPLALLVIQPDARCDLDRFEGWLAAAGAELNVVRPYLGERIPPTLEEDGLVVLGGAGSSNDDAGHPWLEDIRSLFREAVTAGKASLGICLGGQLLAQAFGGNVTPGRDGLEVGMTEVACRDGAGDDPLLRGLPSPFPAVNFHYDEILDLPGEAEWLADGYRYPHQAFRIGSAWGLQFHPEVTPDRLRRWNTIAENADPALTDELEEVARVFDRKDGEVAAAMSQLAMNFLDEVRRRAAVAEPTIRILVIQPDPIGLPARLVDWLDEPGVEISLVRPFLDGVVPERLEADALILLGGGMNAYAEDAHPWLADIKDLYRQAAEMDLPVLGICLGAQMLATTFGGTVTVDDPAGPEAEVVTVEWTEEGRDDPLTGGLPTPFRAAAFHFDGITQLPPGAVRLGTGGRYPNQVFRIGAAVGVQFHPECTPNLFREWSAEAVVTHPELAASLDAGLRQFERLDLEVVLATRALVRNFMQYVRDFRYSTLATSGAGA